MRCFSVLGTRVSRGIMPSLDRSGRLGIPIGRETIPMHTDWSAAVLDLLRITESKTLHAITNADFAFKNVPINGDEEVVTVDIDDDAATVTEKLVFTRLTPENKRTDRDERALVLVRSDRPRRGRRVDVGYSSTVFDEIIEKGIVIRRYRDIVQARGLTVCKSWETGFILILEPGAGFRMNRSGREPNTFFFTWNARTKRIDIQTRKAFTVRDQRATG